MKSIGNISELPEQLAIAQRAISLPEVQEIMRKLSEYNLGVYMPHMHDEKTGAFQVLPEGMTQVEDGFRVSFQQLHQLGDSFAPVAWFWHNGPTPGAQCKAICLTVHHAPINDTNRDAMGTGDTVF
jgi:hypothetical protein